MFTVLVLQLFVHLHLITSTLKYLCEVCSVFWENMYLVSTWTVVRNVWYISSCRFGRFWSRRKHRAKYRGPWWRLPAVSLSVTYSQVCDWVSIDSDGTQWSDTTLCHVTQHGHLVEIDRLCYNSDSTLYNRMPIGKQGKSRTSGRFSCHCISVNSQGHLYLHLYNWSQCKYNCTVIIIDR
jgi:hypothetical protein